jgi:hypothetical protein
MWTHSGMFWLNHGAKSGRWIMGSLLGRVSCCIGRLWAAFLEQRRCRNGTCSNAHVLQFEGGEQLVGDQV